MRLLRNLGDRAVELNEWFFDTGDLLQASTSAGLNDEELTESLTILLEKRILLLGRDEAGVLRGGHLTDGGLDAYLQSCRPSYLKEQLGVRRKLAECFYKETPGVSDRTLAEALGYPRLVVDLVATCARRACRSLRERLKQCATLALAETRDRLARAHLATCQQAFDLLRAVARQRHKQLCDPGRGEVGGSVGEHGDE